MKLALVLKTWDASRGGAQKSVADLAGGLIRKGHSVSILAAEARDAAGMEWVRIDGATDRAFHRAAERALSAGGYDLSVAFSPVRGADLYYPHGGSWISWERRNRASAESGPYRSFQRLRTAVSPKQREARRAESRLLSSPDLKGVVAISRWVGADLASDYGLASDRIHLLYNGVDVVRFSPDAEIRARERKRLGWEDLRVCLFAAHNFRLKGLANAVRCMAELPADSNDLMCVVGKGDAGPYRALAKKLGCADRVRFLGTTSDLLPYYRAADLFLQPTFYDPCSLATLEALACGLPVVTSRWNGVGELITLQGGGIVVPDPGDAVGAARAVRALSAPERNAAARAEARRLAQEYSEERWLERALVLFERLAQG